MDSVTLKELISSKKSDKLEFSTYVNKESICRSISAFLNSGGGVLLLGVQEGGHISGVSDAETSWKDIYHGILTNILPQPPVSGGVEEINGSSIIYIQTSIGVAKPYLFKDNCYVKNFNETVVANYQQIMTLIKSSVSDRQDWEGQLSVGASFNTLDSGHIRSTIVRINEFLKAPIFDEADPLRFLTTLSVFKNGLATNAGVLLFGSDVTQFIPQSRVRITMFYGTDKRTKTITTSLIMGNLFDIYEKCQIQIAKMLRNRGDFSLRAIKEAVKNAIIHNDYSKSTSEISILIFKDRVEIENSIKNNLVVGEKELPSLNHYNPIIAHFFFLCGFTSKLGLGCSIIVQEAKLISTKKPKWEVAGDRIVCTLYGGDVKDPDGRKRNSRDTGAFNALTETIENIIFDGIDKKVIDKLSNSVMEAMIELLRTLHRRPGQNAEALSKKMTRPKPTIERYLQLFKKMDCIYFEGSPKSGGYFIREEIRDMLIQTEHFK